jgi:ribosomal-protein-alanine N-acetyltransferase
MIRRDMPKVLDIENESFEFPWSADDFFRCLKIRNQIGMVAEQSVDSIVGFMIYELHKNRIHISSLAVAKSARLTGVGSAMIAKLTGKLMRERRNRIDVDVRETNVDAQLFFKRKGFRANRIYKNFYSETNEDAYGMQYRYETKPEELTDPNNRLAKLTGFRETFPHW